MRIARALAAWVAVVLVCCRRSPGGDAGAVDQQPAAGPPRGGGRARAPTSIGFEDGRFYANGWHITGEMGGVWAPPLKLVDGVWFGVDDQWVGPATKFTSGWGYTRYDLPDTGGLQLQRTDFAPDGRRARAVRAPADQPGRGRRDRRRSRSTRTPS